MYKYEELRPKVFTEDGVDALLKIRDRARALLNEGGAFQLDAVIRGAIGDTWVMLACVDYLVERGEIVETTKGRDVAGQNRVFTRPPVSR